MVVHADLQSTIIDRNEYMIYRLMKQVPAHGEMSGCKEDELRKQRNEDEDDDPSVHKEGELLSASPTQLST